MDGWMMQTKEGRKLAEFIDAALAITACALFIGMFFVVLIQLRPGIQAWIKTAQGWLFG